jgi:mRNA interferase MazF
MSYVPRRGDLVWLSLDPQAGHEQARRRPTFVLSPEAYNRKTALFLACPVTSKAKGYPFEVALPDGPGISGVILADQIKSLDWKARRAEYASSSTNSVVNEVVSLVLPLIDENG